MDGCPTLELMTERTVFVETGIGKQWGSCGKGGIVSTGTEHTAIWPSDIAGLYTILSLEQASLQDFAGSMPATGGSLPPPDPC